MEPVRVFHVAATERICLQSRRSRRSWVRPNEEATTTNEGKSVRSLRVGSARGVCGVARLVRGVHHGRRRAPCIRSLAEPTRLTGNVQTGSQVTPMVSATVDTVALRHNLQVVRRWAPRSRVMAVIKANAYGHGLVAVARVLEGVFDRGQQDAAAAARFELVVHTPEQIELLRATRPGQRFKVWLKLDSGMNRLGFKGAAFDAAHSALSALDSVQSPVNLFTHLASADLPQLPTTAEQLARFAAATGSLSGERSLENSAAMLSYPDAQRDWVRPGLLLYGVSPFAGSIGADYGLRPAMTLHSHVIAVKELAPG